MNPPLKTIRLGSLSVQLRAYADDRYGFDYVPPGESRVKVRAKTLEKAEAKAREILGAARGGKVERLSIDEAEYAEFLRWKAEKGKGGLIASLVESFLATKEGKGRSIQTTRRLRCDLDAFALAFPQSIEKVSRGQIERWLDSRNVGPRRWNNLRESIVALTRFARREGAIGAQLHGAELIERRRVVVKVETYSPEELERLIAVVPDEWLPLIVLGAFCGLRPMEICPDTRNGGEKPALRWENILWSKRKVDVPAECSKVRRRRFVPICDAAMAFLAPYLTAIGPVVPRRDMHKLTASWGAAASVPWKGDALRHSYASYRLAQTHDMAALALELGNSPAMIFRHYLDLKHEDEAVKWFGIRPSEPVNLVRLSA